MTDHKGAVMSDQPDKVTIDRKVFASDKPIEWWLSDLADVLEEKGDSLGALALLGLANQIEAQLPAPKIDEPTLPGAVVLDRDGVVWSRREWPSTVLWEQSSGTQCQRWADVDAVELLYPGYDAAAHEGGGR